MEGAKVPKFGNWENAGDVPYTQYFDNARKGRTGKMINPNDPQENPEAFSGEASPVHGTPSRTGSEQDTPRPRHERRLSREDGDHRRVVGSPLRHETAGRKYSLDSPNNRYGERATPSETQRRTSRLSGGSARSIEQSPVHPHQHAKSASKGGVSSPSWERKSSEGYGNSSNTPGRSKMRPGARDDDSLERGSTVPKFGAWDESDPSSADGFSLIFNKVREEKQIGSTKVPVVSNDPNGRARASSSESVGCCGCFSLGRSSDL